MIYQRAMDPFSDEQIDRAMLTAALTLKFFPKPAELIELIQGTSKDNAILAWETLLMAVQRYGSYQSVLFGDGKIARTVEMMGGWLDVCAMTEEETKWKAKDFMAIYQGLPASEPKPLIGRYERDNRIRGFINAIPDPVLIGDHDDNQPRRLEAS